MSTPVVVQGTPVSNPYAGTSTQAAAPVTQSSSTPTKGEKQETRCRDPIFAILFYANVVAIAAVAGAYGPAALETDENDGGNSSDEYSGYVIATVICALLSFLFSALAVAVMMCIPETLIKVSLIFVVVLSGLWAVFSFLSGSIIGGILGIFFFAISICYARMVWSRIPFATVNLVTGCTAIKANVGVVVVAYLITALAGIWSITWSVAFVGVFDETYSCDDETNVCDDPNYGFLFLLFVAYFFGHQVLQVCPTEPRTFRVAQYLTLSLAELHPCLGGWHRGNLVV